MEPWETEPLFLLHFCGRNKNRAQSEPFGARGYPSMSLIWEKTGSFICRGACVSVSGGSISAVTSNG